MIFSLLKKNLQKEEGFISILSLMILVTLTIGGIMVINLSNNETKIVRNEQISKTDFYAAESGINDARVNYNNWLDNDFLNTDETEAQKEINTVAVDANNNPIATMQIRCIESTATPVFDTIADQMPSMKHISPPPAGSGYSVKYFESRRYSITATPNAGGAVVQAGVWKVFNKY